jgi:competence protein ComFC
MLTDLIHLFFPKYCGACSKTLTNPIDELCLACENELIFESEANCSDLKNALRGRLKIISGAYLNDYNKKEGMQKALHSIKYHKRRKLAVILAEQLAIKLGKSFFKKIDYIVPVPLHPKKMKTRGFNQCLLIAQGIKNRTSIPIVSDCLIRKEFTESQTNKNRLERWENVENAFAFKNEPSIKNKHLLLVDDVFTTGATIEACIKTIQRKILCDCSVITLAKA